MTRVRDRGVVILMVIGILATLAIAGTAFVVVMSQEDMAAANALHLAQAELAARSGLEHAIAVIDSGLEKLEPAGDWLVVTPDGALDRATETPALDAGDPDAGWHRCFEPTPAEVAALSYHTLSDPALWVSHYFADADTNGVNDERYGAEAFGAAEPTDHQMLGRVIDIHADPSGPPTNTSKRGEYAVCIADLDGKLHANLARWTNGLGGDGAATPAPVNQAALIGAAAGIEGAGLPDAERDSLVDLSHAAAPECSSLSEVARRAGVDPDAEERKYVLERFFTAYPVAGLEVPGEFTASACNFVDPNSTIAFSPDWALAEDDAKGLVVRFDSSGACFAIVAKASIAEITVAGDCSAVIPPETFRILPPRPAVNVSTAPEALVAEILKSPMRLEEDTVETDAESDLKAEALAAYLCSRRPFVDRHELEDAIFRVVGNQADDHALIDWPGNGAVEQLPGITMGLTERQFNDVLNGVAGRLAADESAFDAPAEPGVYSFDGWEPYQPGEVGPSQTGGDCSAADGTPADHVTKFPADVTWSTELKFGSRFFHVYVVGRGWHEKAYTPVGVKRLHAIYDAEPRGGGQGRIVWLRWNLSSRGTVTDLEMP